MRFLLGLIVGVALTIGAAYVSDTMAAKPLVNCDVLGSTTGKIIGFATDQWQKYVK